MTSPLDAANSYTGLTDFSIIVRRLQVGPLSGPGPTYSPWSCFFQPLNWIFIIYVLLRGSNRSNKLYKSNFKSFLRVCYSHWMAFFFCLWWFWNASTFFSIKLKMFYTGRVFFGLFAPPLFLSTTSCFCKTHFSLFFFRSSWAFCLEFLTVLLHTKN